MRKAFPVRYSFAVVRNVLPIVLAVNFSSVFAQTVDSPLPIKQPAAPERKMASKLNDSELQGGKLSFENVNDSDGICRPLDGGWVEPFEFGNDGKAENRSSREATSTTLTRERKSMWNEPRNASPGGAK